MDVQSLSDRAEIIELVAEYNRASFYCDVDAYANTFSHDGRYLNANLGWIGFGGGAAADAIAAEYHDGTGLQHLCLDFMIEFVGSDRAHLRHHMFLFQREGPENPNQVWSTGFYYRTVVRTDAGWRFAEVVSFVDRRMDDSLVCNLRGIIFSRKEILDPLVALLGLSGAEILGAVKSGTAVAGLGGTRAPASAVVDTVAAVLQRYAPDSNPLPRGTATALATVLTHEQVDGYQTERRFRAAGWQGFDR
jgi:SnoaL-like domain